MNYTVKPVLLLHHRLIQYLLKTTDTNACNKFTISALNSRHLSTYSN
jgi:hypothetical protein